MARRRQTYSREEILALYESPFPVEMSELPVTSIEPVYPSYPYGPVEDISPSPQKRIPERFQEHLEGPPGFDEESANLHEFAEPHRAPRVVPVTDFVPIVLPTPKQALPKPVPLIGVWEIPKAKPPVPAPLVVEAAKQEPKGRMPLVVEQVKKEPKGRVPQVIDEVKKEPKGGVPLVIDEVKKETRGRMPLVVEQVRKEPKGRIPPVVDEVKKETKGRMPVHPMLNSRKLPSRPADFTPMNFAIPTVGPDPIISQERQFAQLLPSHLFDF
jgi:hypothetical protein